MTRMEQSPFSLLMITGMLYDCSSTCKIVQYLSVFFVHVTKLYTHSGRLCLITVFLSV
jgi:hypothetical protein